MAIRKQPETDKPDKPQPKWVAGARYKCILSKSPGYKVGQSYAAFKDGDGIIKMKAGDGFTDICSMLLSGFEKVDV